MKPFMMTCVHCKASKSKITEIRESQKNGWIRRRRECLSCKKKFTTYEFTKRPINLVLLKRDVLQVQNKLDQLLSLFTN